MQQTDLKHSHDFKIWQQKFYKKCYMFLFNLVASDNLFVWRKNDNGLPCDITILVQHFFFPATCLLVNNMVWNNETKTVCLSLEAYIGAFSGTDDDSSMSMLEWCQRASTQNKTRSAIHWQCLPSLLDKKILLMLILHLGSEWIHCSSTCFQMKVYGRFCTPSWHRCTRSQQNQKWGMVLQTQPFE